MRNEIWQKRTSSIGDLRALKDSQDLVLVRSYILVS